MAGNKTIILDRAPDDGDSAKQSCQGGHIDTVNSDKRSGQQPDADGKTRELNERLDSPLIMGFSAWPTPWVGLNDNVNSGSRSDFSIFIAAVGVFIAVYCVFIAVSMMSSLMDTPSGPSHAVVIKTALGAEEVNVTYHSQPSNHSLGGSGSSGNVSSGGGEDDEMSAEERELLLVTRFVMYGVLGNVLVVLGLLGNTLSIAVLCNRRMRSSTSYYLTSLAVYDNFILLTMLLFFNLPALGERVPTISGWFDTYLIMMPVWYPLGLAAQMGSIYTCVAFTVERFIAVCRPLHAANTCTKSRAKRTILLIFLWAILYNIPRYFHYQASSQWNNATQAHQTRVQVTEFAQDDVFRHVYIIYFQLLFMFLLPFLIISVLNTALVRAINRSRQQRQQMSTSATREHNLTVMLVAVIVVFLVCQFPTIVDNILVAIVKEAKHNKVLEYQVLFTVCTFLVTINSSLNFVLYCLFGKKFRMVLCHVLGLAGSAARNDCQYRSTIYQSRTNGTPTTHTNTYDVEVSIV
ncbi:hypothetical protein ACOMHN_032851 [Nucella lapillus]